MGVWVLILGLQAHHTGAQGLDARKKHPQHIGRRQHVAETEPALCQKGSAMQAVALGGQLIDACTHSLPQSRDTLAVLLVNDDGGGDLAAQLLYARGRVNIDSGLRHDDCDLSTGAHEFRLSP